MRTDWPKVDEPMKKLFEQHGLEGHVVPVRVDEDRIVIVALSELGRAFVRAIHAEQRATAN